MTWLLVSIIASVGLIVGILAGMLLMYGIITKTLGKEGRKNLEDAEKKHREYLESAATGHEIMERNGAAINRIAKAIASASGSQTDIDKFARYSADKLERENAFLIMVVTDMANEFMEAGDLGHVVYPANPHLESNVNLAMGV